MHLLTSVGSELCYERLIFPSAHTSSAPQGSEWPTASAMFILTVLQKMWLLLFYDGKQAKGVTKCSAQSHRGCLWQDEWLNPNPKFHLWIFPFGCRFDAQPLDFELCLISFESIRRVALG